MSRAFCIPGIFFLTCALILLIIASISLPSFPAMDIVRVHFEGKSASTGGDAINQLRLGIWAYCGYSTDGSRTCSASHHAYSVGVKSPTDSTSATIGASWTRGTATTPVAAAVTLIALIFSLSQHITMTLVASLLSFLAATITLVAFAIDIALYAFVKHEMHNVNGVNPNTLTGPAFWLTFASFLLLLLAGCTVCFGRRRDRMSGATSSYPLTTHTGDEKSSGLFSRFKR